METPAIDQKTALDEFIQVKTEIEELEKKFEVPEKEWLINQERYTYCLNMISEKTQPDYIKYITGILRQYKANLMVKDEFIQIKTEIDDLEKKFEVPEKEWLINQAWYKDCLKMISEKAVPDYVNITSTLRQYKANLMAELESIPPK